MYNNSHSHIGSWTIGTGGRIDLHLNSGGYYTTRSDTDERVYIGHVSKQEAIRQIDRVVNRAMYMTFNQA